MIPQNLERILHQIPETVKLVVVSKTRSNSEILEAYNQGQRIFGENRVPEMVEKEADLPKDIQWHFIGHLQTNKVKYIAPFVSMIHAIDSFKLLKEIDKRAHNEGRVIDGLLQFHIADESSKYGLTENDLEFIKSGAFREYKGVRICGVMGMATFTEDTEQVRQEFKKLHGIYDDLKSGPFAGDEFFTEISMGMSGDYAIAIEEGSTMIRIGSDIFGPRE